MWKCDCGLPIKTFYFVIDGGRLIFFQHEGKSVELCPKCGCTLLRLYLYQLRKFNSLLPIHAETIPCRPSPEFLKNFSASSVSFD